MKNSMDVSKYKIKTSHKGVYSQRSDGLSYKEKVGSSNLPMPTRMNMKKKNEKKTSQLGMPIGTASHILKKNILFNLLKRHKENICFQCGKEIKTVNELSVEHKIAWLDSENPKKLFFDLDNIAFSHLSCNIGQAKKKKPAMIHGTLTMYIKQACRCELCKKKSTEVKREYRKKKRARTING